jgi:hypothetical protein
MSACPNALSAKPLPQPIDARAARLKKFRREQRIVDHLNRGVSVAEIAAQVGVGEKRLRAIIREILARRMPHPPEEFVAIQMSRLNEALFVAFSAMSTTNLKAVDQVVKIVRELDRYGGAFAAEWARPAASRLEAPGEGDVAFAKAWLAGGALADEAGDERPEIPWQVPEKIESAPGNPLALRERGEGPDARPGLAPPPPLWGRIEVGGRANFGDLEPWGLPNWEGGATPLPVLPPQGGKGPKSPAFSGDGKKRRSENPAQGFEKIESAPGIADVPADPSPAREAELCVAPDPDNRQVSPNAPAGADPALSRGANGRGCGPAQPLAFGHCERPENPAQLPDKIDSAPETARPAAAAVPNDVSLILTPTGWKPMRMALTGAAA